MLLPALMAPQLVVLSSELARLCDAPQKTEMFHKRLGALTGRLLCPGGWVAGARHAGSEPLVTGRSRPYDESTLRVQAREWAKAGGTNAVTLELRKQVENAADAQGEEVWAYTDIHDQPLFTKRPAHAGPIGRLGNRILAATYFGLTFLRLGATGPSLGYHISWHKPATPLHDALKDLYADNARAAWFKARVKVHNWDRGGNGRKVIAWAVAQGIPYFTIAGKSTHHTRYKQPTLLTANGLPVVVRLDAEASAAKTDASNSIIPRQVVFPAHPEQGQACSKALIYLIGAPLNDEQFAMMDKHYKSRWPAMENQIKKLLGVGFGVNRDRTLALTTSRGSDGKLTEMEAKEAQLQDEVTELELLATTAAKGKINTRKRKLKKLRCRRAALRRQPNTKHVRTPTGSELLCKNLMLLVVNALTLVLAASPIPAVRAMTPLMLRHLFLARTALTSINGSTMTLWVDPVSDASQHAMQLEIARLFDEADLRAGDRTLRVRMQKRIYDPPFR